MPFAISEKIHEVYDRAKDIQANSGKLKESIELKKAQQTEQEKAASTKAHSEEISRVHAAIKKQMPQIFEGDDAAFIKEKLKAFGIDDVDKMLSEATPADTPQQKAQHAFAERLVYPLALLVNHYKGKLDALSKTQQARNQSQALLNGGDKAQPEDKKMTLDQAMNATMAIGRR